MKQCSDGLCSVMPPPPPRRSQDRHASLGVVVQSGGAKCGDTTMNHAFGSCQIVPDLQICHLYGQHGTAWYSGCTCIYNAFPYVAHAKASD